MEDRYIIRKYNEREYALYDNEQNKYVQKGSLAEMQAMLQYANNPKFKDMINNFNKGDEVDKPSDIDEQNDKPLVGESYNGFGRKLTESGTDAAVSAISKYQKDDKTFDTEWFNDVVQLTIQNTENLQQSIIGRRPAHSVAYEGMIDTLNNDISKQLTGRQYQAGFKKLGLDFKEILKPTVDWINEQRLEDKEESKDVKIEDVVTNPRIKDLANEVFDWYDNDMGNHFDEIKDNEKEVYNHILSSLENGDKETIDVYIKDMSEDESMKVVVNQLKQLKDNKLNEELFSASDDVKEDSREKGLYTESVESDNIERIKDCMKQSGIKNPNTLERMSKDVLAILHTYNEDTRDENGLYYLPAILNAIQDKIEQITGKRPELTIEPKTVKTESEESIEDITYLFDEFDWEFDVTTKEQLGSDYSYHTLVKNVHEAETFNYHSDYWGSADAYQEDVVNVVKCFEPYIGKEVTITYDEGEVGKFKVIGILIDKQYNSIGHLKVLVEPLGEVKTETKITEKVEDDKEKTILDYLQDRIGQKMDVSELNNLLQSLFGKYNDMFITFDTIVNSLDWDEPQELYVVDDDDTYTVIYNIIDIEKGTIEITDVVME